MLVNEVDKHYLSALGFWPEEGDRKWFFRKNVRVVVGGYEGVWLVVYADYKRTTLEWECHFNRNVPVEVLEHALISADRVVRS